MMRKKEYRVPALQVIECCGEGSLLAGSLQSGSATSESYESGGDPFTEGAPAPEFGPELFGE